MSSVKKELTNFVIVVTFPPDDAHLVAFASLKLRRSLRNDRSTAPIKPVEHASEDEDSVEIPE